MIGYYIDFEWQVIVVGGFFYYFIVGVDIDVLIRVFLCDVCIFYFCDICYEWLDMLFLVFEQLFLQVIYEGFVWVYMERIDGIWYFVLGKWIEIYV